MTNMAQTSNEASMEQAGVQLVDLEVLQKAALLDRMELSFSSLSSHDCPEDVH
jgi:hypothetical protein